MTVQTTIFFCMTSNGLGVIEASRKNTVFSKVTIGKDLENFITTALQDRNDESFALLITKLLSDAEQGGWGNAPGAYFLKHNGWQVGLPCFSPSGIPADITLTIRTDNPII